jgi:hypothetical protein
MNRAPLILVERADRAHHRDAVRHDVPAHSAMDGADGDHRRRRGDVRLSRHNALQAEHEV